ncbi:MAG: hypothetical protein WCG87_06875 [Bacteroidota bacterium]
MIRKYTLLLLMLCLSFSGFSKGKHHRCCTKRKAVKGINVAFHPLKPFASNTVRIYMDRLGNVYPTTYSINEDVFYMHGVPCKKRCVKKYDCANLEEYFTKYDIIGMNNLKRDYHATDFDGVQSELVKTYASEINSRLAKSKSKKLVMLIHGFNDATPYDAYNLVEDHISDKFGNTDATYLEVYWDGLTGMCRDPKCNGIWNIATTNAAWAAVTLRKVMAKVNNNTDVYVITHNLGAGVAARMMFNNGWDCCPTSKCQDNPNIVMKKLATPRQRSITLAMLAPAIPGVGTFHNINFTVPQNSSSNYKRVVVGYNEHDRSIRGGRFSCFCGRRHKATSLGCNYRNDVASTRCILNIFNENVQYLTTDFSCRSCRRPRQKDFIYYIKDAKFGIFLNNTFDDYAVPTVNQPTMASL